LKCALLAYFFPLNLSFVCVSLLNVSNNGPVVKKLRTILMTLHDPQMP